MENLIIQDNSFDCFSQPSYRIVFGKSLMEFEYNQSDLLIKSVGYFIFDKLMSDFKEHLKISNKEYILLIKRLKNYLENAPTYPTKLHKHFLNLIMEYVQNEIIIELCVDLISLDVFYSSISDLSDRDPSKKIKCLAVFSPYFFTDWDDDLIKLSHSDCEKYIEIFDFIASTSNIEASPIFNEYCNKIQTYYQKKYRNLDAFILSK